MDLRQLRAVVAVADERHFTRAAARLHITQPALSQQIRGLENELGVALIERTTRTVAMTEAGTALVSRARPALAEIDAARAEIGERLGLLTGTLTIGMTQTPGALQLPKLLARFHHRHPSIALVVREGLSLYLADDLRAGRFDLAFLTELDAPAMRGLERRTVVSEPLALMVSSGHRLSARRSVRMRELREEPFVSFREDATIRTAVQAAAARAGFEPHTAFEANEASRIRAIVAEGLGVSVLPQSEATTPDDSIRTIKINDAALVHRVSVVWRTAHRHSPATDAFLALIREGQEAKDLSRLSGEGEFGEVGFLEGDETARELEQREMVLVFL